MIQTAVVLLPSGDAGWPLAMLAGIPLVERNLMALKSAGIADVRLCCDPTILPEIEDHFSRRSADRRLPQVQLQDLSSVSHLSFEGMVVALDGRRVYHPGLLKDAAGRKTAVSYQTVDGRPANIEIVAQRFSENFIEFKSSEPVTVPDGTFAQPADSAAGLKEAERLVFKSLIKPTDGWFSVNLNRPISISISRLLVRFSIHPNFVTFCFFLVGVASGVVSALGTYLGLALGGVLFQLYSILDGVDGEIARVKFLSSRTGEWLDTLSDNLANVFFLSGVTVGVYRSLGSEPLLWIGIATVALCIATASIMSWQLATKFRSGTMLGFEWDIKKPESRKNPLSRLLLSLEPVMKRDFFSILFMVFTLAGVPWLVLVFSVIAFSIYLAVILAQTIRRWLATRRLDGPDGSLDAESECMDFRRSKERPVR